MLRLTGAELTIRLLENQGVTHIAGIPVGFNLPLYDALGRILDADDAAHDSGEDDR